MGNYVKKKKEMVFQSVDSLQQVVNVVNEAAKSLQSTNVNIERMNIFEIFIIRIISA